MVFIKHSSLRSLRWCQLRFYHTLRRRYGGLTSDHAEQYSDATSLEKHEETSKTNMPRFSAVERDPGNAFKQYLMQPDTPPDGKLIRVAILGAPNAGKSTFINKTMGWKVNSVSKKVHTTKKNTNSVFTVDNTQIIFVDTPGVISVREKLKHQVDASVLKEPESSLEEADLVGVVVDGSNRWTRNTLHPEIIKTLLLYRNVPSFLILNKVDEVTQKYLLLEATRLLTAGLIGGKKFSTSAYTKNKERSLESLQKDPQKMFSYLESKYGKLDVKHSQSGERLAAGSKRGNKEKDEEDKLFNIRNVIENEKKLSKDVQRMKEKLSDVAENSTTRLSNQPPGTLKHLRNKPPATLKDLRNQPPATSQDLSNQNPATSKDLHNQMPAFSKTSVTNRQPL